MSSKIFKTFQSNSLIIPLVSIVLGILTGALVMLAGGYNPIDAYLALLDKVFGSLNGFGETIRAITPLLFCGLAVAFAFRAGLFNIGGEGQFMVGMTAATLIGVKLDLPAIIHAPLAVIVGGLAGGLWAAIAGFLKANRGVNEVITTIMLNWTALHLSNYMINTFLLEQGQQRSEAIHESASASLIWLSDFMGSARLHWGTLIAVLATVFFHIYLNKTKQGYELRAVGYNIHAAQYAGMNVKRNIVKAMFISGIFAGLAGAFEVLGVFHYQVISAALPGYGFDGIAVALLGMNNPIGVFLSAALFGILNYGASGMSFAADVPPEIMRVVIGAIIFFVAAQGIVRALIAPFYSRRKKERMQ